MAALASGRETLVRETTGSTASTKNVTGCASIWSTLANIQWSDAKYAAVVALLRKQTIPLSVPHQDKVPLARGGRVNRRNEPLPTPMADATGSQRPLHPSVARFVRRVRQHMSHFQLDTNDQLLFIPQGPPPWHDTADDSLVPRGAASASGASSTSVSGDSDANDANASDPGWSHYSQRAALKVMPKSMINDYLQRVWSAPLTGALRGRDALFSRVREETVGISRRTVMEFLRKQELRKVQVPGPPHAVTQPIVVSGPMQHWQADITYFSQLSKANPTAGDTSIVHTMSASTTSHSESLGGASTTSPPPQLPFLLVVVDVFSKFVWARPLVTRKASEVVEVLSALFLHEGSPAVLHTDNGPEFRNYAVMELCKRHAVRFVHGAPHRPTTQGAVERMNKTLKKMLWNLMLARGVREWTRWLPFTVFSYNTTVHAVTQLTPFQVHRGRGRVSAPLEPIQITVQTIADGAFQIPGRPGVALLVTVFDSVSPPALACIDMFSGFVSLRVLRCAKDAKGTSDTMEATIGMHLRHLFAQDGPPERLCVVTASGSASTNDSESKDSNDSNDSNDHSNTTRYWEEACAMFGVQRLTIAAGGATQAPISTLIAALKALVDTNKRDWATKPHALAAAWNDAQGGGLEDKTNESLQTALTPRHVHRGRAIAIRPLLQWDKVGGQPGSASTAGPVVTQEDLNREATQGHELTWRITKREAEQVFPDWEYTELASTNGDIRVPATKVERPPNLLAVVPASANVNASANMRDGVNMSTASDASGTQCDIASPSSNATVPHSNTAAHETHRHGLANAWLKTFAAAENKRVIAVHARLRQKADAMVERDAKQWATKGPFEVGDAVRIHLHEVDPATRRRLKSKEPVPRWSELLYRVAARVVWPAPSTNTVTAALREEAVKAAETLLGGHGAHDTNSKHSNIKVGNETANVRYLLAIAEGEVLYRGDRPAYGPTKLDPRGYTAHALSRVGKWTHADEGRGGPVPTGDAYGGVAVDHRDFYQSHVPSM